jgi:glycosyltransferase involved in cell wall biosynthesis
MIDQTGDTIRVLWLRPTKPDNISVGRERVAEHLREMECSVDILDASGLDAIRASLVAARGNHDIIVGTVRMGLYVGTILSWLTDRPIIADVTDPIEQIDHLPSPVYRFLFEFEHFALKTADEVMFVYHSSYTAAKRRGIDGEKIENGVNYEQFDDPDPAVIETAAAELDEAGLDDRPIVVYIGGLTPVYHIGSILEAALRLDAVQFLFIGDGDLSETVAEAATTAENVYYLGTYNHELIPGFVAVTDIGLCLVDAEQPLKVLEYGAAGLPVIAIPGELQKRFSDDELLFADPDEELVNVITDLVDDPELANHYGTNLRRRAASNNWTQVATQYRHAIKWATHE